MGMFKAGKSAPPAKPNARSAYSAASEEFADWGMVLPTKPKHDMPLVEDDIGDLADGELMSVFNQLTGWANYIAVRLAKAEVDEDDAEAALKVAEAKYMITGTGRGDKVTVVRAERETDEDVLDLAFEVRRCHAFRKMTATLMSNTERTIFMVSRELTRRTGLAPQLGRRTGP